MAVALAMVLLPVLYVGFVVLWGWAVFLYATTAFPLVLEHVRNWQLITLAATPILADLITTVFLLKPFFGRRESPSGCRSSMASRCGSSRAFSRNEFGRFSQGAGMRLGFIIRSINAWFAGVVYGRDHWDARLERWRQDASTWIVQVVLGAAVLCVSLSRRVLRLLMQGGDALSMLLSRQMEFDADQAEARAVGSTAFADTSRRLHVLDMASRWAHSDLGVAWRKRQLSDDFPALVQANLRQMPSSQVEQMLSSAVHSTPSMYDSHPPTEQRIARATSPHWDGVFVGDIEIAAAEALGEACDRSFARIVELRRIRAIVDVEVPIQAAASRTHSVHWGPPGDPEQPRAAWSGHEPRARPAGSEPDGLPVSRRRAAGSCAGAPGSARPGAAHH